MRSVGVIRFISIFHFALAAHAQLPAASGFFPALGAGGKEHVGSGFGETPADLAAAKIIGLSKHT